MRKATAADRILMLVTTPESAASIVGDLLEQTDGRCGHRFWAGVFGTVVWHVWQDMRPAPFRMLWLAVSGLLESVIVTIFLLNTVTQTWIAVWPYQLSPNEAYIPPWGFYGLLMLGNTVAPLLAGWDAARRSDHRPVAAGTALAFAVAVLATVRLIGSGRFAQHVERPYPHVESSGYMFAAMALCFMAGAVLRRLQENKRYFGRAF